MAVLLRTIYDAHQEPMQQVYMEDLFSVGKVYDSAGVTTLQKGAMFPSKTASAAAWRDAR